MGSRVEVLEAERRRINKVRIVQRDVAETPTRTPTVERRRSMKSGFVSFIGRPNAGKSTLLNRLVGRSSRSSRTSRRRPGRGFWASGTTPDAQVVFLDTPGIHRPLHRMNVRMVDAAVDTIRRGGRARPGRRRDRAAGQRRSIRARPGQEVDRARVPRS